MADRVIKRQVNGTEVREAWHDNGDGTYSRIGYLAGGTAGTPAGSVQSVQGVTSGTPVSVSSSAVTPTSTDATILSGASLSGAIDLAGKTAVRLITPAAWTAAVLTLQFSPDNVTFNNVYDSYGSEYTIQAAASRTILLIPADFLGIRYLKLRSGTSGAAVNQGADRVITVVSRPVS